MKIAKLHKPQRMSNRNIVLAYQGQEDIPVPEIEVDDDANFDSNLDSIVVTTDSTGVTTTGRGYKKTIYGDGGVRTTITFDTPFGHKKGAGDDPDSTMVNLSLGPVSIEMAIPINPNPGPPSPPYMGPGPVEYDQFGNPLYH